MRTIIATLGALLSFSSLANAQNLALVLSNGYYENGADVATISHKHQQLVNALENQGYEVIGGKDLNRLETRQRIGEFADKIEQADTVLAEQPLWILLRKSGEEDMLLAAVEFYRHKTTIMPRRDSRVFVQSGIYKRSRNPIYLGDAMVLAGLILRWDAVLSLPLIPIFVWVIETRFIIGEEKHLRLTYRAQYAAYAHKVRRWI